MTLIVGIKDNNHSYIIGDRQATCGNNKKTIYEPKVWKSGQVLMGISGSPRFLQIAKYHFTPDLALGEPDLTSLLVHKFVKPLRELFKQEGYAEINDNHESTWDSLLFIVKNRIFSMGYNYQLNEYTAPFLAIGSGATEAMAILTNGFLSENFTRSRTKKYYAQRTIKDIFRTVSYLNNTVSFPIDIIRDDGEMRTFAYPKDIKKEFWK